MTHDIIERKEHNVITPPLENNIKQVFVEIDITSLDSDGIETSFTADDYVESVESVMVGGQEDGNYAFRYDRGKDELHLTDADTNGTVNAGTAIGVVELIVQGR